MIFTLFVNSFHNSVLKKLSKKFKSQKEILLKLRQVSTKNIKEKEKEKDAIDTTEKEKKRVYKSLMLILQP